MNIRQIKRVCAISTAIAAFCGGGCRQEAKRQLVSDVSPGATIGSLVEVFSFDVVPVEGYALVGGLSGTGSSECQPQIREYLEKYILGQLPDLKTDVEKLISSHDTAVVSVRGLMPAAVSKNQRFDVLVEAMPDTQTTSLEDGWLYGSDLKAGGGFGVTTRVLAKAEGPVFMDTTDTSEVNKRVGYVLGGGMVLDEYKTSLAIRKPDYRMANLIRNRLNERFGRDTAKAISDSQIDLKVPAKYKEQKQRFISLVKAMYLSQNREITKRRITRLITELAVSQDKYASEVALEAIGNESLGKLAALLNSSDERVRFQAARCMLNLGSDEGLECLRQITMDKNSRYRIEAVDAIAAAADRNATAAILRRLLREEDFNVRLAAYENLRKLDDITITRNLIGRNIYLEQITQTDKKAIFVSRSGLPRIVLFGTPLYCRDDVFIRSANGKVTLNAPAGQNHVSIIYKHPTRPEIIIQLKSSFELGDIIQTLCEEPVKKSEDGRVGLGISYTNIIEILKQMCDKGAVKAEFRAGPVPKIGLIVKKNEAIGR